MKRYWLVLAVWVVAAGCASRRYAVIVPRDTVVCPANIRERVLEAKIRTKRMIEEIDGKPLMRELPLSLVLRPGEDRSSGIWRYHWEGRMVGGLCWGTRIELACNPEDPSDISGGALQHELTHYWLGINYNISNHPCRYRLLFGMCDD